MELAGNEALEAWFSAQLAEDVKITHAEKLSGGAIQENWGLTLQLCLGERPIERSVVLRKDAPAVIAASRSRGEEFALIATAHRSGVRVPEPIAICTAHSPLGSSFAVFARCTGTGYGPKVVKDTSIGGDRAALGRELGRQLARIHQIPVDDELAQILGAKPADPGLAQIAQLRGWLDEIKAQRPGLEWGLRWAELHAPKPNQIVLTHQDYRTGNFLIDEHGLSAILDWEFACWSDPMADIGWFTAECWRFSRPDLEGGGLCTRQQFYEGYEVESGQKIEPERVRWWELMAHLRWAVIAIQQGHRHRSGEERSLHLELTGRIADGLEMKVLGMTRPADFGEHA